MRTYLKKETDRAHGLTYWKLKSLMSRIKNKFGACVVWLEHKLITNCLVLVPRDKYYNIL